ncbi:MAG: ribokinase [Spirochaetales bacterium]
MAGRIVVVGSSNVDFTMRVEHLPRRGETVTNAEFMQSFGGKGANQAVAAARSGGAVTFVNCVGDDPYTEKMLANFAADGIDLSHIYRETGISSGSALVMVGEGGDNYLTVAPGSNYRLTPQRIRELKPSLAAADWILCQFEILPETLETLLDVASEAGTPVVVNTAPARELDRQSAAKTHTFVANEGEAYVMLGLDPDRAVAAEELAEGLRGLGTSVGIVTLGAKGSVIATETGVRRVAAFPVEAVDTTAAGDTYCGCLVTALAEGKPIDEAVRFAGAAASLSVQRFGAQPSTPTREAIDRFLAERS